MLCPGHSCLRHVFWRPCRPLLCHRRTLCLRRTFFHRRTLCLRHVLCLRHALCLKRALRLSCTLCLRFRFLREYHDLRLGLRIAKLFFGPGLYDCKGHPCHSAKYYCAADSRHHPGKPFLFIKRPCLYLLIYKIKFFLLLFRHSVIPLFTQYPVILADIYEHSMNLDKFHVSISPIIG